MQPIENVESSELDLSPNSSSICFEFEQGAPNDHVCVHPWSQKGQVMKDHPLDKVIGYITAPMKTRRQVRDDVNFHCYVSCLEPKNVVEALKDDSWKVAMHEELEMFERNSVWELVPRPTHTNVIGTKWIFENKTDELGGVIRIKARLVAQGYTQLEGIDFDETFVLVTRLESIRILFAIACHLKIKLHQMDVKSAFLNGYLNGATKGF